LIFLMFRKVVRNFFARFTILFHTHHDTDHSNL
jgi:hypothetical protein